MMGALIVLALGNMFLVGMLLYLYESRRDAKEKNDILEEDNKWLKRKLGGLEERAFYLERGLDPEECAKHHFPGDCPLCGAE